MADAPVAEIDTTVVAFLAVCGLPDVLIAKFIAHCAATEDSPRDVIADAVIFHLDALGDLMPERAGEAMISAGVMAS